MNEPFPPPAPDVPLLACHGLTKVFTLAGGSTIRIFENLDLEVAEGELLAITGSSGVGKSTLLHLLGLLETPDAGTISYRGRELHGLNGPDRARFRNRLVGFVFQFHQLLPEFSALENVMMPCLIAGLDRREAETRASRLLEEVGLGERLLHRPGKLSGGEQQRVAIARALVMAPPLVLADEPTGNLDPVTSRKVHRLFRQIQRQLGFSALLVTHNEELAAGCDRVLRMNEGRLVPLDGSAGSAG